MKSVTMISWELHPFHTLGGTAYAIRRLADQLTELEIKTRVLLPDCLEASPGKDLSPFLMPKILKMRAEHLRAPRLLQCSEFSRAALEAVEQIRANGGSDAVIAHSLEGAIPIIQRNGNRSGGPSVFWLHSLYDPPISDLSKDQRRVLPSGSLLSSAVMMADIVVTSTGILKDAQEFEWPDRLKELQRALIMALAEDRVLTVESMGCLPAAGSSQNKLIAGANLEKLKNVPSPFVLFPARPALAKGFGFFAAIAERLRAYNIASVAVQHPAPSAKPPKPSRKAHIYWLPWLTQNELLIAQHKATCTVLPSITEGFGLAAAESISQNVTTLYQQVGGHHDLQRFPNAMPVSLTTNERAQLYSLWSELIDFHDSWPVWKKYEISLGPLIDRWVEAIRSVVYRPNGVTRKIENADFPEVPVEDRWANRLCRRIEAGAKVETNTRMAASIEHRPKLSPRDGRPRLIHLMPWDLTVGGAQRMLDVWCAHEAHRWDTHILTVGARGGKTWTNTAARTEGLAFGEWGWKIQFLNKRIGFIALENFRDAAILKTTDGGETWTRKHVAASQERMPPINNDLEGIGFVDELTGWVGGWGDDFNGYYNSFTQDGGETWTRQDYDPVNPGSGDPRYRINRYRFIGQPVTAGYCCGQQVFKLSATRKKSAFGKKTALGAISEFSLPQPARREPAHSGQIYRATDHAQDAALSMSSLPGFEISQLPTEQGEVEISYTLPKDTPNVFIGLWNKFAFHVRTLINEQSQTKGRQTVVWDGKDDAGNPVGNGLFICRICIDGEVGDSQMIRLLGSV